MDDAKGFSKHFHVSGMGDEVHADALSIYKDADHVLHSQSRVEREQLTRKIQTEIQDMTPDERLELMNTMRIYQEGVILKKPGLLPHLSLMNDARKDHEDNVSSLQFQSSDHGANGKKTFTVELPHKNMQDVIKRADGVVTTVNYDSDADAAHKIYRSVKTSTGDRFDLESGAYNSSHETHASYKHSKGNIKEHDVSFLNVRHNGGIDYNYHLSPTTDLVRNLNADGSKESRLSDYGTDDYFIH